MNWQVLYVKSRAESKVADRLSNKGYEVFCPMETTVKQWSDRKKKVKQPYFRSYVFVRFASPERIAVLQTPGVVRFVYWLGKPAVIREKEMEEVMAFFSANKREKIVCESFREGQNLFIKDGPLQEKQGIVVRQSKHKVVLQIQQLGLSLSVEIQKSNVGALSQ